VDEVRSGVALPTRTVAGTVVQVVESCNSTWLFDTQRLRFRRVPKGISLEAPHGGEWRPYARLELEPDADAFVVALNEDGTRLLRSWRHNGPCPQCEPTAELWLLPDRGASA
jgi:hypothetical protein